MDLARYRAMFVTEAQEHLRQMNGAVLHLEQDPADAGRIDGLFRNAHSIKGMAASMGFEAVAALSHRLEDLMDRYRQGRAAVEPAVIDILLEGIDALTHHIQAIAEDAEPEIALEPLIEKVSAFLGGGPVAAPRGAVRAGPQAEPPGPGPRAGTHPPEESEGPSAPGSPLPGRARPGEIHPGGGEAGHPSAPAQRKADEYPEQGSPELPPAPGPARTLLKVDVEIAREAASTRVRAFMVHRRLTELGTVVAAVPSAADLKSGEGHFGGTLTAALETGAAVEDIRAALASMPDVASVSVEVAGVVPASTDGSAAGTSRGASRTEPAEGRRPRAPSPSPVGPAPTGPAPIGPGTGGPTRRHATTDQVGPTRTRVPRTVKVQTDLLDSFVNLAGELLVVESRLKEVTRDLEVPPVKDALASLGKLVRSLHTQVMTVRMMPLATVAEALPRVVRDLARREGKEVAFVQEGTELELDRGVLEELPDLLTHILRNAVDHGIEPAEWREAAGKPRRGEIRLKAFRQKDQVVIRIEDDGRGMDPARLKAKAVERGHLTPEQAAAMSDADALYLACLPGLSTAAQVTDVSGRGVGMDAVKARIEALGGALRLESRPGQGTRISLQLPVSVAIIHVLLLGLGDEVFAIPVAKVLRTLELEGSQLEAQGRQLLFRYGEERVPLLSLRKILRLPAREGKGRILTVAVVQVRRRTVGLVVDRFVGQQEAFIKPLPRPLTAIDGVAGVTILGDGRAIFLLDSENLF